MAKLDLSEWRGVLVVSGDGLVNEVYNGLFIRYTLQPLTGLTKGPLSGITQYNFDWNP